MGWFKARTNDKEWPRIYPAYTRIMDSYKMIRLPGTEHLPLSPRIETDGTFFEPFSMEWIERNQNAYDVAVLVKDGRIFGGKEFSLDKNFDILKEGKIRIYYQLYVYRFAIIPLDEIVGIRKGYLYD